MSFTEYLASHHDAVRNDASLNDVVDELLAHPSTKQHALQPERSIVGTRKLTNTLTKLSGVFRQGRAAFDQYKNQVDTSIPHVADEFEAFTEAVLEHKPTRQSLGDNLQSELRTWMDERAAHLDNIHNRAKDVYQRIQGDQATDYVVFRFEPLDDDPQTNMTKAYSLTDIPNNIVEHNKGRSRIDHEKERRRREHMRFPTEEQSLQHLHENVLPSLSQQQEQDISKETQRGRLRITSENHSVFNNVHSEYNADNPHAKIISRTKQGQVGDIASEPLKLWKSMFGDRDSYSYDSIALWPANMSPEHNIRFLLALAHGQRTVAGNGTANSVAQTANQFNEEASYVADGFRIQAKNHTPGTPFDFHRRANRLARANDEYKAVRDLARMNPPTPKQETKREYTYDWAVGQDNNVPADLAKLYENTLDGLVKDYKAYQDVVIRPRDKALVQDGDQSIYSFKDTMIGWKGELITQFKTNGSFCDRTSKAGEINVPLEIMIGDEPPYRQGAGWYAGIDGPGRHNGNHSGYKSESLSEKERLEQEGLYPSYERFASYFPTLST